MLGRRHAMFIALCTLLLITGCSAFSLTLSFSDIQGLEKGNPVFFDQNQVGQITHITYTENGAYLVTVEIDKDFKAAFTEHSRFDIIASPLKENEKAILMRLAQKGGKPLENGDTIEALPSSPFQGLAPFLERFRTRMDDFFNDMKTLPENEKYQAFEKKIDALAQQMKASGKAFQERLKNEIIPRLKQELDALGKKLNEEEKDQKTRPLEKKLNALEDV